MTIMRVGQSLGDQEMKPKIPRSTMLVHIMNRKALLAGAVTKGKSRDCRSPAQPILMRAD